MRTKNILIIVLLILLGLGVVADAGWDYNRPNAIFLEYVKADAGLGLVVVEWKTTFEAQTSGFFVMRGTSSTGPFEPFNDELFEASPGSSGDIYTRVDRGVTGGTTYYYYIREYTDGGDIVDYPELMASATPLAVVYLPFIIK